MFSEILEQPLNGWIKKDESSLIVLSSRIRLARNLAGFPFVNRGGETELIRIEQKMRHVVESLKAVTKKGFSVLPIEQLSEGEREILVEKHLISPAFTEPKAYRSLIISDDASVSIMINEEDHLRVQIMEAGLNLEKAWERAKEIDECIENVCEYAFDSQWGYITACPTNVGTGMRASVMLHLPALAMTKKIERILRSIIQLGYSVRGLYGEGSESLGHIYQISNQITMGISEIETVTQLQRLIKKIVEEEEQARKKLKQEELPWLEDKIWRSYGILSYARSIRGNEALSLLSDVQLGRELGILPECKDSFFQALLVMTRPNFLEKYVKGEQLNSRARDQARADVIRMMINSR